MRKQKANGMKMDGCQKMIRNILSYLFGCRFMKLDLCPGGYIENGEFICHKCGRVIHKIKGN
jgi:hypothetical protein